MDVREYAAQLASINIHNRVFWEDLWAKTEIRLEDRALCLVALDTIQEERGFLLRRQTSFEQALANAERAKIRLASEFSRAGGRESKTDALQLLIRDFVRDNPSIRLKELLKKLSVLAPGKVVVEITGLDGDEEQTIHFQDKNKLKEASVKGLKDRLSRAKKSAKAEIASTG